MPEPSQPADASALIGRIVAAGGAATSSAGVTEATLRAIVDSTDFVAGRAVRTGGNGPEPETAVWWPAPAPAASPAPAPAASPAPAPASPPAPAAPAAPVTAGSPAFTLPVTLGDGSVVTLDFFTHDGRQPDPALVTVLRAAAPVIGDAVGRIDARQEELAAIERSEKILDFAGDAFIGITEDGTVTDWNQQAERTFGYSATEAVGAQLTDLIIPPEYRADHRAGVARFVRHGHGRIGTRYIELEALRKGGDRFDAEMTFWGLRQFDGWHFFSFIRDISERKSREVELIRRARFDESTGLPNRTTLLESLATILQRSLADEQSCVVYLVEITRFEAVKDSLGHQAADQVAKLVAERLRAQCTEDVQIARIAESEFVVVNPYVRAENHSSSWAMKLAAELQAPMSLSGDAIAVSVAIGVMWTDGSESAETVLRDLSAGLHGRGDDAVVTLVDDEARSRVRRRLQVESELAVAIADGQLRAYYQPVLDLATGHVVGAEALVRWQHPHLGLLSPGEFIDIAEESGQIVALGSWMLQEVASQARRWQQEGFHELGFSVNLSARQLAQSDLVGEIEAAQRPPADGSQDDKPLYLILEITETLVMNDPIGAAATLGELKKRGVRLALDDFGTGYSSLAYLKNFPIDVIKIDRSFVDGIDRDPSNRAIVRAVTELGHGLGLRVLAEGIETEAERETLVAMGCDLAQGFLFGRPMPPEEFRAMLVAGACALP